MKGIQRWETWALLAGSIALALWALAPKGDEDWEGPGAAEPGSGEVALAIRSATLERDYGNARLDLRVRVENPAAHPLPMTPPRVRLLAGEGGRREVAPFFLPAEPPAEVGPGAASEVLLRYWLEAADLEGALTLRVDDSEVPVKSARPLPLDRLENGKPNALRGVDW